MGNRKRGRTDTLNKQADLDLVHVPYRGAAAAVADLMAGQVAMVIDSAATAIPVTRSGQVRALAATATARLRPLPDLPAATETLPGYDAYTWNALLARARTPAEAVGGRNAVTNAVLGQQDLRIGLEDLGITVVADSAPASVDSFLRSEAPK